MPLLTGLTADGVEVPVQVEPDGVLVAEGIQGAPGPQGPEGPQGPQGPKGDPGQGATGVGASAWANIADDGTLVNGFNIASVDNTQAGEYRVTFTNPMPIDNYAAVGNITSNSKLESRTLIVKDLITTSCIVLTKTDAEYRNYPFTLVVFSQVA